MKKIFKSPIFWGIIAALLVIVPQINVYQFAGTDCFHIGVLEGLIKYPGVGPFTLYQFADGNPDRMSEMISEGQYPWFTSPDWKVSFCRHLPSALIALNHKICGLKPFGYVIHSLLWYMALISILGLLVKRIVPGWHGKLSHPVTYLTLIIFAFSTSHLLIVCYGATRWLLIATTLALAGLLAHLKWREQGWKPGRYLSLIAFFLALLSGEAALAVLAYLAAYELFGSQEPFKKRIKALLPTALLVFVYLIFYRVMDYGTGGQDLYINPLTDPITFITALPTRLASMLAEMFFGIISLFRVNPIIPSMGLFTLLAGAAALVIGGLLFYPVWSKASVDQRRKTRWLIIGTIAAMFPLASGYPSARVAMIPFIGGSVLLAFILHHWWHKLSKKRNIRQNLKSPGAWIGGLVIIVLFFLHLVLSPYRWFTDAREFKEYLDSQEEFNRNSTVLNEILPHQEAIFLHSSTNIDLTSDVYYYRKINRLPLPGAWWQLSFYSQKHRYLRTAEDKLELELIGGSIFDHFPFLSVLRSSKTPLKKGEVIKLSGLQITILEVNENGPTRIEFKFDRSLDDERYLFFKFQDGALHTIPPPSVGQSISL
ncbi:MAG: hypothetical protein JSV88_22245 [Candidatus Aminicenantes bacterium]|nr:MAG: hypothetical protein JSV88_22245 [Candidatus Aminicenantes bacterium]